MGDWKYILINGKSKQLEIQNPVYDKETGQLTSIEDLRPFQKKDSEGNAIEPTPEIANSEKRKIYGEFFKKPFKNLLILSGAGSSMDVGGLSMWKLWQATQEKYKIEKTDDTDEVDGLKVICEKVNFDEKETNLELLLSQIDGIIKYANDPEITIGTVTKKLSIIKEEIFELIKEKCTIPTPKENFPHKVFLEKLLQRKQTNPRIKVFVTIQPKLNDRYGKLN